MRSAAKDVRAAVERVMNQLDRPLADTWGCSLHGHVVTLVERLGAVSTAVQRIAEGGQDARPDGREDLVEQLAELAVNAVVMLVESSRGHRSGADGRTNDYRRRHTVNFPVQRRITEMSYEREHSMNAGAVARDVMSTDGALADPRGVTWSDRLTDDDSDVVLFDTRGRQVNPLPR